MLVKNVCELPEVKMVKIGQNRPMVARNRLRQSIVGFRTAFYPATFQIVRASTHADDDEHTPSTHV